MYQKRLSQGEPSTIQYADTTINATKQAKEELNYCKGETTPDPLPPNLDLRLAIGENYEHYSNNSGGSNPHMEYAFSASWQRGAFYRGE